jgi:putative transposase
MLIINGMPDHIHILFGMHPTQSLSQCMQTVNGESSEWINRKHFVRGKFEWQEGYGAFSCDVTKRDIIFKYIQEQKLHHGKRSFIDEYKEILVEFQVQYKDAFIFQIPD